jgi:hypothetical protein
MRPATNTLCAQCDDLAALQLRYDVACELIAIHERTTTDHVRCLVEREIRVRAGLTEEMAP